MNRRREESDTVLPADHQDLLVVDPVLQPHFGTAGMRRRLPRGLSSLPPEVVEASYRSRLMHAMAHVVAHKGYAATSVSDLTAHAGMSRASFYELYKDKEDCFLYCFEKCSRAHLAAVEQAAADTPVLPQKLFIAIATYLSIADANPWFTKTFIVEAYSATPATQAAVEQVRDRLTAWLKEWFDAVRLKYPTVESRGDLDFTLVQEAASGFIVSYVRGNKHPLVHQSSLVARFMFAAFGLYGWAEHVASGKADFGTPVG